MSKIRGSSSTTRTRLWDIAASIAPEGVFSRKNSELRGKHPASRGIAQGCSIPADDFRMLDASSGGGLAVAELDDEELLHLLLQRFELRVGDQGVGDLRRLAVPGLLDPQLAVLGPVEADAALAREEQGGEVGDLLAVGVLGGLLQELLEELLHRVDVLEALHLAAGHPGLPEREEFGLLGPAGDADVAALEAALDLRDSGVDDS